MSYINENSFSRWIIEKSDGLIMLGLQKLSETVRDYTYLILTSQTSTRGPIIGHEARNLDAQRVFLNTFENIVNRRVDIPKDLRRFQKTLQYARSKIGYVIGEFIGENMLPSNMNLLNGKVKNYNDKVLISLPSFKSGSNLKINLDGEKDKPDVKSKTEPNIKSNKEHKQDVKIIRTKPKIESNKGHKQDVKMMKTEPDMNRITYEEEKVPLVLGITSIFTVWWMFK